MVCFTGIERTDGQAQVKGVSGSATWSRTWRKTNRSEVFGSSAPGENPNGSQDDIAGVCNEAGNVLGLMPHPEHAVDPLSGSVDGLCMFESIRAHVGRHAAV